MICLNEFPLVFPPFQVNVLSQEFSSELVGAMREAFESPESRSIVLISSKPGCFIAGADISMLDAAGSVEEVGCRKLHSSNLWCPLEL